MWGGIKVEKPVVPIRQAQEKETPDIPYIEVDSVESEEETVASFKEDALDLQSEGTRPPTSDEEIYSSPPSKSASLQGLDGEYIARIA